MKKILLLALALMATTSLLFSADKDAAKQNSDEGVQYVVNNCPVTPVREEPSEAAEQATQLLFGEICEVVERKSSWTKIRSIMDGQEGWVSTKMMTSISQEELHHLKQLEQQSLGVVATPMAVATDIQTGEKRMLTIGTRLPNYADGMFEVQGRKYQIDENCAWSFQDIKREGEEVVRVARSLLNVPYLWGGKNMMGYDCSGFTQTVYSVFGIQLLRNAREQVTQGEVVRSLAESRPGDLVFFDHADRDPNATRITHVGMLISPTEVIHCSGCVHVDRIDDMGIHLANGEMTHHLAAIKRYL